MSGDVDLSIRQFREAWRLLCAGSPAASMATTDGIEYVFSGLPISFFNIATPGPSAGPTPGGFQTLP